MEAKKSDEKKMLYFNYMWYGKSNIITSLQFLNFLPILDIFIITIYTTINLLFIYTFKNSLFQGVLLYMISTTCLNIISILVLLIFRLRLKKELTNEKSHLYKVVYFIRLFFVTLGLLNSCSYLMFIYFIYYFESLIDLQAEIKNKVLMSIDELPISIEYLYYMNYIFQIISFITLTHQIYWHGLLDNSWVDNLKHVKKKHEELEEDSDNINGEKKENKSEKSPIEHDGTSSLNYSDF